jgi:hypothetical protein
MRATYEIMDVLVDYEDFQIAHERAMRDGRSTDTLQVQAEVDIDEALELASVDQLRQALSREEAPGYTSDQLVAIHDCFAAVSHGDFGTAAAMLHRAFEHSALIDAAERGLGLYAHRIAA